MNTATLSCKENEIDLLIFDAELSPSQTRNIEDETDTRVVDRTTLILDIFAARAMSGEGKIQVEILNYSGISTTEFKAGNDAGWDLSPNQWSRSLSRQYSYTNAGTEDKYQE